MSAPAAAALVALALSATAAFAQDPALREIEQLAASGRLTEARASLERWTRDHPESAAGIANDVRAHALILTARMAVDPNAARASYQAVALGYPTTSFAAEALLRIGQGLVAAAEIGDRQAATRAVGTLERLASDYPGSPFRPAGLLWLVRAHVLAGRTDRACNVARDALEVGLDDADIADMLRVEFSAHSCPGRPPGR